MFIGEGGSSEWSLCYGLCGSPRMARTKLWPIPQKSPSRAQQLP